MSEKTQTPAVQLGQYKGLPVVRHLRPVTDEAVDHEVVHQCRIHARYTPSDQPAHRGSRVSLDFEGFMEGEPIPDSKMTNVTVVLGTGKLMPAAEQAIYGHCAGETFRFDFTYPEDFRVAELSGLTAQFEIRLYAVAEKVILEPGEEIARMCGHSSLAEMKQAIRAQKLAVHDAAADRKAGAELLDAAGWNMTAELPQDRIEALAEQEMKKLSSRLEKSGIPMEVYCETSRTTPEKLRQDYRRTAEGRIRAVLAAKIISETEKITVTHAEVEAEYRRLSAQQDTPENEIRRVLNPETIAAALTTRKVQEFLLANAQVTTVVDEPFHKKESKPNEV